MSERTLAIFDLDGTITRRDTLLPYLGGFLWRHPRRWWRLPLCLPPVARYLATNRDRGVLKGAIIQRLLGGLTRVQLAGWSRAYTARLLRRGVYAEALQCIAAHRRAQAHLVLLSASPDLYVPHIAQALGFEECICTELRWHSDGTLEGTLASANRRGAEKARWVAILLAEQMPLLSYAYGNSPADLEHLSMVSAGTFVNGSALRLSGRPNVHAVRWRQHGSASPCDPVPGATGQDVTYRRPEAN